MRRKTVTIRHPKTKTTSEVSAVAVPAWKKAGWQVVEDKPSEAASQSNRGAKASETTKES